MPAPDLLVEAHKLRRNLHNNNIHTYDEVPEVTKGDDPILGGGVTLKEINKQQQTAIQGWANYRKLITHKGEPENF